MSGRVDSLRSTMKLRAFIAISTLAFAGNVFADGEYGHVHDHQPRHGGLVFEVNDLALEVVANPSRIQIHVREHGQPTDISRANATLTLFAGGHRQDVGLKPVGSGLEATGSFRVGGGTKAILVLALPGRPVASTRFGFN